MIYQRRITVLTAAATLTYAQMGDVIANAAGDIALTLPAPSPSLWYLVGSVGAGNTAVSDGTTTLTTLKTGEQALFVCNGTTGWWMTRGGSSFELTKAAIEDVLTGEINTHSHAAAAAPNGIPTGGTANQLLAKKTVTDFDVQWLDAPAAANGIPAAGAAGQVLKKVSAADYDAQWDDESGGTEENVWGAL